MIVVSEPHTSYYRSSAYGGEFHEISADLRPRQLLGKFSSKTDFRWAKVAIKITFSLNCPGCITLHSTNQINLAHAYQTKPL